MVGGKTKNGKPGFPGIPIGPVGPLEYPLILFQVYSLFFENFEVEKRHKNTFLSLKK
jgi:hypothetical protein